MRALREYDLLKTAIDEAKSIPACQVTDPEIWFADIDVGFNHTRIAKNFCKRCPVLNECATYAIAAEETHGIWGGLTPKERSTIRNQGRVRGVGRPVKEKTPTT
jgi:WhiB family redox-sensing transcriptional regulator